MYINTQTQKYPMSERDVRAEFPNTSFPQTFVAPEPYAWVFATPTPTFDAITHTLREIAPELTNKGTWEQRWEVVALDEDAVAVNRIANAQRIQSECVNATQQRLDDFAKTRNYDSILSACTYATSTLQKFQQEGQRCVELRDNTWNTLYELMAEVEAGTKPMPTSFAEVELLLPILSWQ